MPTNDDNRPHPSLIPVCQSHLALLEEVEQHLFQLGRETSHLQGQLCRILGLKGAVQEVEQVRQILWPNQTVKTVVDCYDCYSLQKHFHIAKTFTNCQESCI